MSASSSGMSAGRDDDDAVEVGGERVQAAGRRVTRAELLLLHGNVDGPAEFVGELRHRRGELVAVAAENHDQVLRPDLGHRMQRVSQHAAAAQRVQDLRSVRPHARSGPGGQHDHGLVGKLCHGASLSLLRRHAAAERTNTLARGQ